METQYFYNNKTKKLNQIDFLKIQKINKIENLYAYLHHNKKDIENHRIRNPRKYPEKKR